MIEISQAVLTKVIKKRRSKSHKGDYGRVMLIGGNENYGGAIIMAAEGALNSGAGLVVVVTHSLNLTALHARDPEIMYLDWHQHNISDLIKKMEVIVCGPGLGLKETAKNLLKLLCQEITSHQTLVLDANALDLIAANHQLLPEKAGKIILTPHQMEWQRLSQIHIPFQTDAANLAALNNLFPRKNAILVLKSNHTKIYDSNGQIYLNPLGNPGMAIGGMGDTLAGIIGGFTAQFGAGIDSILAAVYLHSLAGDKIAQTEYIVKPTKLSALIPHLMKEYGS
ncbi:NAD(P)H-hydrate dehydratase [Lactobacillus sp. ESL0228]|uniref:NAD(P)H-hydrate dehydratase n=1 Tax=Lactobacillus sp. ESL0228 TaxID=2069352 RepID=UPI000EFD2D5F|nr:NAD(P)H-hydrate dehydratase [Lactobacillus sp. ESL0228]RMC49141.1 NAD(P)H-hydrate dehydratase [Lactobacillus sp. ESL0228]